MWAVLTQMQAWRQAMLKELYVGVIGWLWVAGCLAVIYYLVGAVFWGRSWWYLIGAALATWAFY